MLIRLLLDLLRTPTTNAAAAVRSPGSGSVTVSWSEPKTRGIEAAGVFATKLLADRNWREDLLDCMMDCLMDKSMSLKIEIFLGGNGLISSIAMHWGCALEMQQLRNLKCSMEHDYLASILDNLLAGSIFNLTHAHAILLKKTQRVATKPTLKAFHVGAKLSHK